MTSPLTGLHPLTFVDVFAVRPLEGNLLPVVHDADDVSDQTMARFARRMRQSETSCVQAATSNGADYRHRIFTVTADCPSPGTPPSAPPRRSATAEASTTRRSSRRPPPASSDSTSG